MEAVRRTGGLEESFRDTALAEDSDEATPDISVDESLPEPQPSPIRLVTMARANDCVEILFITSPWYS
jgi:hypothetical protein